VRLRAFYQSMKNRVSPLRSRKSTLMPILVRALIKIPSSTQVSPHERRTISPKPKRTMHHHRKSNSQTRNIVIKRRRFDQSTDTPRATWDSRDSKRVSRPSTRVSRSILPATRTPDFDLKTLGTLVSFTRMRIPLSFRTRFLAERKVSRRID